MASASASSSRSSRCGGGNPANGPRPSCRPAGAALPPVAARLNLKLDKTVAPLPHDSIFRVRYRSTFGLKYLEVIRGAGPSAPEGHVFDGTDDGAVCDLPTEGGRFAASRSRRTAATVASRVRRSSTRSTTPSTARPGGPSGRTLSATEARSRAAASHSTRRSPSCPRSVRDLRPVGRGALGPRVEPEPVHQRPLRTSLATQLPAAREQARVVAPLRRLRSARSRRTPRR